MNFEKKVLTFKFAVLCYLFSYPLIYILIPLIYIPLIYIPPFPLNKQNAEGTCSSIFMWRVMNRQIPFNQKVFPGATSVHTVEDVDNPHLHY